jgi:hypothetical protein
MALVVIAQHGLIAGGFIPSPSAWNDMAAIAVDRFFAISGFLVARSRLSLKSSRRRFLWHPFLCIRPGFWACLAVVAPGIAGSLCYLGLAAFGGLLLREDRSGDGLVAAGTGTCFIEAFRERPGRTDVDRPDSRPAVRPGHAPVRPRRARTRSGRPT